MAKLVEKTKTVRFYLFSASVCLSPKIKKAAANRGSFSCYYFPFLISLFSLFWMRLNSDEAICG